MDFVYFKVEKQESERLKAKYKEKVKPIEAKHKEIVEQYGADGLYMKGDSAIGICFKKGNEIDPRGFKVRDIFQGKESFKAYTPDKRFKEGKKLYQMLDEYFLLRKKCPSFSDCIVTHFRLGADIVETTPIGTVLHSSSAGYVEGHILIKVPVNEDRPGPALPPMHCTQIKKSEFIAMTEESETA